MKILRNILAAVFLSALLTSGYAEAAGRGVFLSKLLDARGLDQSIAKEKGGAKDKSGAAFMLRAGLVTDAVGDLNAPVTRREALRWCVQSLGLAFEAELFSGLPSGFKDAGSLTAFERGCLFVASRMDPPLFAKAEAFRGGQRLADKELTALLGRVAKASRGLKLDVALAPQKGLSLRIHRDGVPTGVPRWRVYATGFDDKNAAVAAQGFFKAQGFEMSPLQPMYEWFLRSPVMDDYGTVRRLGGLIKKRGLGLSILPVLSNPGTEILPRYWAFLTVDPTFWRLVPIVPQDGPRALAPLSRIARESGVKTAINAGFFACTGRNRGYPIGLLRVEGEVLSKPWPGRTCLGWNGDDEAMTGIVAGDGDFLIDGDGNSWDEMDSIIQAGPLLFDDGEPKWDSEGFNASLLNARHPRSAMGLTADGEWFFLAVDGRNGLHASGATVPELMEILRGYGVSCALNLDGGGSTELLVGGKIYNALSEGKERPISYGVGLLGR